jgi:hypothetical protein
MKYFSEAYSVDFRNQNKEIATFFPGKGDASKVITLAIVPKFLNH